MSNDERKCVNCGNIFHAVKLDELEEYEYLLCLECALKARKYEQFVRSLGFTDYDYLEDLKEQVT